MGRVLEVMCSRTKLSNHQMCLPQKPKNTKSDSTLVLPPQGVTEKFIPPLGHIVKRQGLRLSVQSLSLMKWNSLKGGFLFGFVHSQTVKTISMMSLIWVFLHNRHEFAKKKSGSTAASILYSSQHLPPKMYRTQRPRTSWHIFWAAHSEVFGQAYTRCARVEGRATPKARFFASTTSFLVPVNVRFEQTRFSHRPECFLLLKNHCHIWRKKKNV